MTWGIFILLWPWFELRADGVNVCDSIKWLLSEPSRVLESLHLTQIFILYICVTYLCMCFMGKSAVDKFQFLKF